MNKRTSSSTVVSSSSGTGFGYGLLLGAVAGAVGYVLVATPKGKQVYRELKEAYDHAHEPTKPAKIPKADHSFPSKSTVQFQPPQKLQPVAPAVNLDQAKTMLETLAEKVQSLAEATSDANKQVKK